MTYVAVSCVVVKIVYVEWVEPKLPEIEDFLDWNNWKWSILHLVESTRNSSNLRIFGA